MPVDTLREARGTPVPRIREADEMTGTRNECGITCFGCESPSHLVRVFPKRAGRSNARSGIGPDVTQLKRGSNCKK